MIRCFRAFLFGSLLLAASAGRAQQAGKFTISGYVRDQATGENLIGVAVVNPGTGQGTATNTYGFYTLTLPASADSVRLLVSYLGYERARLAVKAERNVSHTFQLRASSSELGNVEIVGSKEEKIAQSTRMGTINVPITQIKLLPALLGETDVLKVLQLLPGVQSGGEGQSGLYVRGGSPDQNLVLLDGTPVYNAAHLFGFFSVFNADAINNVELIKGGFPARYGGRLSSVLDISMKEGNMKEFHGEGAVGIVASKLTLEGPIKKDTASFIISARRTYLDILARPLIAAAAASEGAEATIGYFFHDLNGKLNWKLGSRDRLYLSAYTGYDKFYARTKDNFNDDEYSKLNSGLGWGNLTSALRWNHVVNDQLFMNTHFTYSKYQFNVGITQEDRRRDGGPNGQLRTDKFDLRYLSNIRDLSLKTDLDYVPSPDHYIRFGGQYILHSFRPGALQAKDNSNPENDLKSGEQKLGSEAGLYAEDDYRLTDRLKVNGGLRLNGFLVDNKLYPSLEPRLAARYLLTEDWSLKAAYARTTQYIHLLTNSGIGLPTDLWVPATAKVKPQRAQQISIGAARNLRFKDEDYELSFESYYKPMQNLIEYREGASFLGTTDNKWEDKVTSGKGWAYGAELFLQKKSGRTTGWVGYTLAWSKRRFPELNQGRIYPYKYDRRHDMSVVVIHTFTPTITLSGTWVYGTGNATTLSEGRFNLGQGGQYEDYGPRNSYRMRAYHRLDLDLSHTKKKRWGEVVNSFSLYNAYSRRNPYYLYFQQGYQDSNGNVQQKPSYRQVSLFPIIPSFSKSFKF
ncbi:CarboxypepD_reg-like domain-containing protein [Hymenobacter daecheongensis DSM 21074]|uniref:CarboxypepD_reg-like domain-containing protein n=1 Tax=Hymenobacter daecheongensis DSM 21074 TaxID=1121955 RepID=A0A1M6GTQ0_9BACT|nr:TonB-dependent receptor [Hymenobacter daecheongensis]SHJ13354.1 CarboxypepD_reg-like domain-containing protein [Hymenobacter daecheongensis DSM 21074]